jgi:predicted aspartyl protease
VQLIFRHNLAFVTATLTCSGTSIEIPDVWVDTGAASTVINADLAAEAQISPARCSRWARRQKLST